MIYRKRKRDTHTSCLWHEEEAARRFASLQWSSLKASICANLDGALLGQQIERSDG